jgi:hypothetical protein
MILNPSSGVGTSPSSHFQTKTSEAQAAGITVLGYVWTDYTSRPIADVKSEIDDYMSWYSVDGIFLDEVSNDGADIAYYQELATYIRSKSGPYIMINPGTVPDEGYMDVADVVVSFESAYSNYASRTFPSWMDNYAQNRFCHLVYDTPEADFGDAWALALSHNVGYVYFTDDASPNPWDTLPTYWSSEVQASNSS